MGDQLELDFGICALADYDEDDHAQIQIDSPGIDGNEGTQPAEVLMPNGFYARPLDPDKGEGTDIGLGAPVLTISHGDHQYVIPLNDPRDVGKVPKLRKGGRMMAGGAGDYRSFILIDGEDPDGAKTAGSLSIAVSYPKSGKKKSLGLSMNVRESGQEEVVLIHGEGQRITLSANGHIVLTNKAGDAYFELGADGHVLAGDTRVSGSLGVGQQLAADSVPLMKALVAYLTALEAALTVGNVGGPIVMPVRIASIVEAMKSKNFTTT